MYKPKTYVRVMEFANALRAVGNRRYRTPLPMWSILARFDNLVERAYEVGHDEGFVEGRQDGRQEGRDEALCHRVKDEEWEYRVVD